ncbi:Na(+)/H(+) antiporter [Haemophilus influenzae]|uniref:Na(+)/H(+) antiporter n=1 Tax=Haemophilus influenzae TaxID=727 RepID=A0A2X1QR04_HAEIF|nr:Na(+)/H(+) antiporter [Haemophilus influenzae]
MATDIAFALGIMALLSKQVPLPLKIFLLALAIIDDLGAIVVIALFFSHGLSVQALIFSAVAIIVLILLNRFKVSRTLRLYGRRCNFMGFRIKVWCACYFSRRYYWF